MIKDQGLESVKAIFEGRKTESDSVLYVKRKDLKILVKKMYAHERDTYLIDKSVSGLSSWGRADQERVAETFGGRYTVSVKNEEVVIEGQSDNVFVCEQKGPGDIRVKKMMKVQFDRETKECDK